MDVEMIEEYTDGKKFAKSIKEYLEKNGAETRVKYAITNTPKGILYSAMMIKN